MKFSLNKILTVSALFALATLTIAAPLKDVSTTSIDLEENTYNAQGDEHLFVTVTRVDDLLDDDGSLLAERVMAVRVTFDVFENQLMCNGRPVEIGVSNIQIEAQMASNPDKLSITSEEEAAILDDTFDIGLVTVEVSASILDELKTDDGMTFRRISVHELITEINGEKVVQTEAGQQILDVYENGSLVKWSVDPLTGFMLPAPANTEEFTYSSHREELSDVAVMSIIGGMVAFLFAFVYGIRQLIVSTQAKYEAVSSQEASNEQIWEQKELPPAYEQKDEEKKPFLSA